MARTEGNGKQYFPVFCFAGVVHYLDAICGSLVYSVSLGWHGYSSGVGFIRKDPKVRDYPYHLISDFGGCVKWGIHLVGGPGLG